MKLRPIGNSLGATFSKEVLAKAGFVEGEELEVLAAHGEIRIRRVSDKLVMELTVAEAQALATGELGSKAGRAVVAKAARLAKRRMG